MWTLEEFQDQIVEKLKESLGSTYCVYPDVSKRMNKKQEICIKIKEKQQDKGCQIYLHPYYADYLEGYPLKEILKSMLHEFEKNRERYEKLFEHIPLKNVHKHIIYRVINYHKNQELLKRLPHILYEDLAIVFCLAEGSEEQIETVFIDRKMMEEWKVNGEELREYAFCNTPKIFPLRLESIAEINGARKTDEPIFVLSNQQKVYGAGAVLYQNVLSDLARKYGWNLYLLPISVHEFLILFDRGQYVQEELLDMIHISNQAVVSEKDFLSDNIYYYDRHDDQFFALF